MGLKAGWLALFIFVWTIGIFLGSTFDYNAAEASEGMAYSTGTATFTTSSDTVEGAGTAWDDATMAGGLIKSDTDGVWYKIESVTDADTLVLYDPYIEYGGGGLDYTMKESAGWAGVGTGGYGTAPSSDLAVIMQTVNAIQRNPVMGIIAVPLNGELWGAIFHIITWQWTFMEGYGMIYWIFLFPFAAMGMLSVLLLAYGIITGNISWS